MKTLKIEVPDSLLKLFGSENDAKALMLHGAITELVKSGQLTKDEAAKMLQEADGEWTRFIESGGAFDFWDTPAEDIYTESDGEPA